MCLAFLVVVAYARAPLAGLSPAATVLGTPLLGPIVLYLRRGGGVGVSEKGGGVPPTVCSWLFVGPTHGVM